MKVRRKSVRSTRARAKVATGRRSRPARKPSKKHTQNARPKQRVGVSTMLHRRSGSVARLVRDNPGKSLIILGMIAMVAIVTIVVLVLPPPAADVDAAVHDLLGDRNIAGEASSLGEEYRYESTALYLWYSSSVGEDDYKPFIE